MARDGTEQVMYLRARYRAYSHLRPRYHRAKSHEEKISKLTRLYVALSQVNETIVRIHDAELMNFEICRIVSEVGGFPLVWIGQVKEQHIVPIAWSGKAANYLKEIKVEIQGELGNGPTGTCIRKNQAIINDNFET